jgi:hypothetical protein
MKNPKCSMLAFPTQTMPNSWDIPIKKIEEALDEFEVSTKEKNNCLKKAIITLRVKMEKGELKEGQVLSIRRGDDYICLCDKDNAAVFIYRFEELVYESEYWDKSEIVEEIVKTETIFQRDIKSHPEFNDIGFYKHAQFGSWCNFNAIEFIGEIKSFEKKSGKKLSLKDCDVKTCKVKGRKYKRITFTNEKHITQLSRIEFAFGTLIEGWTYLILSDKWAQIKDEVISLVDYQETTYGSKTRWDLNGNEYKAEH